MSTLSIAPTQLMPHLERGVWDSNSIPDAEVGKISYYLKCCVFGCGITIINLPPFAFDYKNAHRLPWESQRILFDLALKVFRLDHLLNRVIFTDDAHVLLPQSAANAFFNVETSKDIMEVARLASLSQQALMFGRLMVCNTEWLRVFYIAPLQQFLGSELGPSRMAVPHTISNGRRSALKHSSHSEKSRSTSPVEYREDDAQETIPMAAAVPLDFPPEDDVAVSLFTKGRYVRFQGLADTKMNDTLAIVAERSHGRIHVVAVGDSLTYSVRPQNLVILEKEMEPTTMDLMFGI